MKKTSFLIIAITMLSCIDHGHTAAIDIGNEHRLNADVTELNIIEKIDSFLSGKGCSFRDRWHSEESYIDPTQAVALFKSIFSSDSILNYKTTSGLSHHKTIKDELKGVIITYKLANPSDNTSIEKLDNGMTLNINISENHDDILYEYDIKKMSDLCYLLSFTKYCHGYTPHKMYPVKPCGGFDIFVIMHDGRYYPVADSYYES